MRRPRTIQLAIASIFVAVFAGLAAPPAQAQLQGVGNSFVVNGLADGTRTKAFYSDVAYDSVDQVYLVVYGTLGNVYGRFVDMDGVPLGSGAFRIPQLPGDGASQYADQPRVAFSPHADNGNGGLGAFLVVWKDERECVIPACATAYHTWTAQARMIAYRPDGRGSALTTNFQISLDGDTYHRKDTHAVAYSPTTQQFLVAYHSQIRGLMGQFVSTIGVLGAAFKIASSTSAFDSAPSLVFNSTRNEFYIVWHRESYATGEHSVLARRFNNATGDWADAGISVGESVPSTGWLDVPEVAWDAWRDRYLIAWYRNLAPAGTTVTAAYINGDDTPIGGQFTVAFSGDKDRMPLGFNTTSGTFLSAFTKWNIAPQPGQDPTDVDRTYGSEVSGPAVASPEIELIPAPHRCHFAAIGSHPSRIEWMVVSSDWMNWDYMWGRRITSAPPVLSISSVSPSLGPTNGGTVVNLTGSLFGTGTTVTFGGIPAAAVTFVSSTLLQATTPAFGTAGWVDVTVTNPDATATKSQAFQYYDPLPLGISITGNGTVAAAGGISCPGACIGYERPGVPVSLWATPATGYIFGGWEGDADCADGVVGMSVATSCVAKFLIVGSVDFDLNRKGDLVFRDPVTLKTTVWYMDGATPQGSAEILPAITDPNWQVVAVGDLDGNGTPDLVWRNKLSGQNTVWLMNGTTLVSWAALPDVPDVNWEIATVADLNGDRKLDIVWRNTVTGVNSVWYMNGLTVASWGYLPTLTDVRLRIVGAGDFNGDGKTDLLLWNSFTGQATVAFMNGAEFTGQALIGAKTDTNWQLATAVDLSGDGKMDLVWHNYATGDNEAWFMDGTTVLSQQPFAAAPVTSVLLHKLTPVIPMDRQHDLDGDGKTDIVWRNTQSGLSSVWYMDGTTLKGWSLMSPTVTDPNWTLAAYGDFDGDGKADLVWRNKSAHLTTIWFMDGPNIRSWAYVSPVVDDPNWDIATAGDMDGDGKADLIWRNSVTGVLSIWFMNGASLKSWSLVNTTLPDLAWQVAAAGDLDGNGTTDLILYNVSTGGAVVWYQYGATTTGYKWIDSPANPTWQLAAVGDFNGDGWVDVVWRNYATGSNEIWHMNDTVHVGTTTLTGVDPSWAMVHKY